MSQDQSPQSSDERRPLTTGEARIVENGVTLSNLLPLKNTRDQILAGLTVRCSDCKQAIEDDDTRACALQWANHVSQGSGRVGFSTRPVLGGTLPAESPMRDGDGAASLAKFIPSPQPNPRAIDT